MPASHPGPMPRWYALPLLVFGAAGFAAAWTLAALAYDVMLPWLAPVAAADMVVLLAVARWPAGVGRGSLAMVATVLVVLAANFGIIAGQLGRGMGLLPWDSAMKLGTAHAWELAMLASGRAEAGWYAAALVVAVVAGTRSWRRNRGHAS